MKTIDIDLQQYLPDILEQAKNGIIVSDPKQPHNPVVYVNNTTCKLFEYSPDDFLGRSCSFLQKDDRNQKELQIISHAIQTQRSATVTVRNYTKSGKLVYNQFTISPIFDENNDLKYFLGIQRNVTNEIILKQLNLQLEEEKIENAQYNAIGKLTGGISHEINTPLTIINGHIEMLQLSLDSVDEKNASFIEAELGKISNNLNRIKHIVESMREISDIKSFEINEINLFRIIVGALRLTHYKAKHIVQIKLQDTFFDLDLERDTHKFIIKGDFRKLQQVFMILIENSLDQLEHHDQFENNMLNIEILKTDTSTQVILFDNGGGIEEHIMKNIFKPFNSNKVHKGLGIGLSIVKKILDEHQFEIFVKNTDSGVRFIIDIPN